MKIKRIKKLKVNSNLFEAESTISKYERIYNNFGIEAFSKISNHGRKCSATRAHNKRAAG